MNKCLLHSWWKQGQQWNAKPLRISNNMSLLHQPVNKPLIHAWYQYSIPKTTLILHITVKKKRKKRPFRNRTCFFIIGASMIWTWCCKRILWHNVCVVPHRALLTVINCTASTTTQLYWHSVLTMIDAYHLLLSFLVRQWAI